MSSLDWPAESHLDESTQDHGNYEKIVKLIVMSRKTLVLSLSHWRKYEKQNKHKKINIKKNEIALQLYTKNISVLKIIIISLYTLF